jgi:hypothetical protein
MHVEVDVVNAVSDSKKRKAEEISDAKNDHDNGTGPNKSQKIDLPSDEDAKIDMTKPVAIFDEVVCLTALDMIIHISKTYLVDFKYFTDHFAAHENATVIPVDAKGEHICELFNYVRNKIQPKNKTEVLMLMQKWRFNQEKAPDMFANYMEFKYIPNMNMDYYRPIIRLVMSRMSSAKIRMVDWRASGPFFKTLPSHILAEILLYYIDLELM